MMKRENRKRYLGYLLFALLFVLISYEFHSAANQASNLEFPDAAWSRKEARVLFTVPFVFILCRFLFTILTVSIRRRFESPNLPFRRVLSYIQRQDGKGPGKLTFY